MGIRNKKMLFTFWAYNMKLNFRSNSAASLWLALKLCMCVNMYAEFIDPGIFSLLFTAAIYCYYTFSRICNVIHSLWVDTFFFRSMSWLIRWTAQMFFPSTFKFIFGFYNSPDAEPIQCQHSTFYSYFE